MSYNFDSIKNQHIKDHFVSREVLACISDFADHLFSDDVNSYANWEDWDNLSHCVCPECGDSFASIDLISTDDDHYACPVCNVILDDSPEEEFAEIYEYWLVSSWLGEKLKEHGQPVYERFGAWIWGRCTTGQAISLDDVISQICAKMEILEGMTHEWDK